MNRKRTTIRQVAKAAGVSLATVSRYLSGKLNVSLDVEERIRKAVKDLNYSPHAIARNLATGRTQVVGLIVPDIANPFFSEMAEAVESIAYKHGYRVMLCNTKNDAEREEKYTQLILNQQVDGLIYMGAYRSNPYLARASSLHLPLVITDEDVENVAASRVFVDNCGGAYKIVQYLLALGHTRIAFIGGPESLYTTQERFKGYCEALNNANIPLESEIIFFGPYTNEFGRQIGNEILSLPEHPTAVFASSISFVLGFLAAIETFNKRIPDDISLVGFDETAITQVLNPPLTTVAQPISEMAVTAFHLLLKLIKKEDEQYQTVILPTSQIIRKSASRPKY